MRPAAPLALLLVSAAWAQPAPAPSYKDLKYPDLRPIRIPKVETYTLANGMKIYLLEDHELPVVNGLARIRVGNLFDPPDQVGLAEMTGAVLRSGGTRDKTGDQIDEQLENLAASVESSIGETSGSVSFSALRENTDEVMGVFRDLIAQPEFRQDKIDLLKIQLRSVIARRNDEAASIATREFAALVYGRNSPYGWRMEYATLDRVTRGGLRAFYDRYYFPANIMLAVWGDFPAPEMKARLERLFGDWKAAQPPVPPFPKVEAAARAGTHQAAKLDVTQTFFALGHLGGELRDKDYPALEVLCDILGGGLQSRLVQRVRAKMGWAYDISAGWGANYGHPGLFQVSGSTKSLSALDTLKAVQEEIARIRSVEVGPEELEVARQTALNGLVFAFDTRAKTLGRMLTYEYYGYPQDFIYQYQKALAAVTRADILRVAKQHLKPEQLVIVAVGNPSEMRRKLDELGSPVTPIDLTIPEIRVAETPATLERGRQLLQRVQQAVGGADKLLAVRDLVETTSIEFDAAIEGGVKATRINRWLAPGRLRQETQVPAGKMVLYCDGEQGWFVTPRGLAALSGNQLQQAKNDVFRIYVRLLVSDRLEGRKVNWVAEDTVEISGGGQAVRLVADPGTGLPRQVVYQSPAPQGRPQEVSETYVDFKDMGGILVPHHTILRQGAQKAADVTLLETRWNTGLTPEEMSKLP
jgi:zinc protease